MAITQKWTDPDDLDLANGGIVTEAIWDNTISNEKYLGEAFEPTMTNGSGGSLSSGTVVIVDTSSDDSFTTTTSAGNPLVIGVLMETTADGSDGRVATSGAVIVNVQGNVTRGQYLQASATEGRAEGMTYITPGSFAIATTEYTGGAAGTVTAIMMPGHGGSWAVIYDTLLTSATASVDITSIPATYKALKLDCSARSDFAGVADNLIITFNGRSAAFDWTYLNVENTTVTAVSTANDTEWTSARITCATAAAGDWGHAVFEFPNYASTSTYPTGLLTNSQMRDSAAVADFWMRSGMCVCDGAAEVISRITLSVANGTNFASGSRFTLSGLK